MTMQKPNNIEAVGASPLFNLQVQHKSEMRSCFAMRLDDELAQDGFYRECCAAGEVTQLGES